MFSGQIHYQWWFSIVLLVITCVFSDLPGLVSECRITFWHHLVQVNPLEIVSFPSIVNAYQRAAMINPRFMIYTRKRNIKTYLDKISQYHPSTSNRWKNPTFADCRWQVPFGGTLKLTMPSGPMKRPRDG